jgi:acetyl esterase/lipase
MTSIKAKLILGLMRNRHLFQGRLKKEVFAYDKSQVLKFRDECEKGATRFGKVPKEVSIQQEVINMSLTEWLTPEKASPDKLIFYVHGGGYISGSCNDHRSIVAKVAKRMGIRTFLYEYGLAPENPFPTAIDDSISLYKAILEKGYKAENILMMGESAGGGLCLALLIALRDKNIPLPKAAVAISPWTDLSCSSESYKTRNKKSLAPLNSWNVFAHYYVGDKDYRNPYISPLYGNLEGLPPLFINSGADDELFEDGQKFAEKARLSGVDTIFREGKGMVHCYPLLDTMFKEASEAMDEIVDFVHQHLK